MVTKNRVPRVQDRTYGQRYHRQHQKAAFWKHHLNCWAQTSLTQVAYCENNGLSKASFSRWKALLSPKVPKRRSRNIKNTILVHRPYYEAKAKCSYCGEEPYGDNKVFLGADETVSICSNCVFQKYKAFLTEHETQCMTCKMDRPSSYIKSQETQIIREYLRLCRTCLLDVVDRAQKNFGRHMTCNFCNHPPTDPKATQRIMVRTESNLYRICGQCIDGVFRHKQLTMKATCITCGVAEGDGRRLVQYETGPVHVCDACISSLAAKVAR